MDKRAAVVLSVIFGGLFLALFGFMALAYSVVKSSSPLAIDGEANVTSSGPRIGVVEVRGPIGQGGEGEQGASADRVVKLLHRYENDDDIKAVLVRIDSPGGAVAPSQEMYRAVRRLRKRKKVVVSMGSLAASGGYYVASAADQIFANPGTLTGSIGVIFTHFNVRGLLEAIRIDETTLKSGKYKDTLSPFRSLADQDREEVQSLSDDVYGQFIHDVADGRGMKEEQVRAIAEGRIYTGRKAKELKLVDEVGSFDEALARAWQLAGQSGEPRMQLPGKERELNLRDLLRGAFQGAAEGAASGFRNLPGSSAGPQFLAPSLVR